MKWKRIASDGDDDDLTQELQHSSDMIMAPRSHWDDRDKFKSRMTAYGHFNPDYSNIASFWM